MSKINNFKIYFSNILSDKYKLNNEEINKYWKNKEKQEKFEKKKNIGILVGLSELMGSFSLCLFDEINNSSLIAPVVIIAGIGAITTKVAVTRKNPYFLKEYREIEYDYEKEKTKYRQ